MTAMNEATERWFTKRGIDPETAVMAGVHTGSDGEIIFPFIEGGQVVNRKHRGKGKKFWQDADAVQTWWNHDVLLEPGFDTLIVTEGEMDGLTAIECGFSQVVSVPCGAPSKEAETNDQDPSSRFHFIYRTWDRLKEVRRFIIATDGDEAGQVLARELVRRFRPQRCLFVSYPDGCKDLNDVLMRHGKPGVVKVIDGAKPYPVKGLYRYADLPPRQKIEPVSTGWNTLDEYFRPFPGQFIVQTGFPGAGKSLWNAAFVANLARLHNWHVTAAVFEEEPQRFADQVKRSYLGRFHGQLPLNDQKRIDGWVNDHLSFIYQLPGRDDDDMDVEYFLDRAEAAVIRHGTKLLILDPWNEIEHKRRSGETENDYIGRAIRQIKRFAKAYEVTVMITAHPTKVQDKREPMLYDISGSSNWANKCDVGLVLSRDPADTRVKLSIRKPRFRECTKHGDIWLNYEWQSGRYHEADVEEDAA